MRYRGRAQRGFTLLELVVAAALLALGTVGVLQAISRGLSNTQRCSDESRAVALAEAKLTEVRRLGKSLGAADRGAFPPPFEDFRWQIDMAPTGTQGLNQVTVLVLWDRGKHTCQVAVESVLPLNSEGSGGQ
ncbi:MAG: prepilin-type N-terminal cleavage/methylation domain-containing protein [Armatimonadetes bacterium]|nr:prepilin-type N-terminal cleavage/methylation domain-containing protein [Armatimonadota bacterium]